MQMVMNVIFTRRNSMDCDLNKKEEIVTANQFIRYLKLYRNRLPKNTIKTLKGQALSGDVSGAVKGLERVLKRLEPMREPMRGVEYEIQNINRQQPQR